MATPNRLIYREFLTDAALRVAISLAIGVVTAVAAKILTTGSSLGFSLWQTQLHEELFALPDVTHMLYLGSALLIGSVLVSAILYFFSDGKVSGPPDTLHALADPDHKVSLKTGMVATAIAGISTASGASVGLYGPLIHFGSLVAEAMRRAFGTATISWQTLVGCGVAAAISAAFLTPIGAALFATEFVMRRMNLRDFLPLAVASSTAWGVALALGSTPVFQLQISNLQLGVGSLLTAAMFGLLLGIVAIGFTKAIEYVTQNVAPKLPFKVLSPVWAALILFAIGCFIPSVLGTGIGFIQSLFTAEHSTIMLLVVLVAKFIATGASVSLRFYGGLFAPSLFVGAVVGAIFGNVIMATPIATMPEISGAVPAFPVIAAFAVASALVGAPFAAAIIILEMTQSYEIAALGFSTCVITCYLYSGFMGRSFFDRRLRDRGLSYEAATPVRRLGVTPVRVLAVTLEDIRRKDEQELKELNTLIDKGSSLLLPADMSALDAMQAMDKAQVNFAEVNLKEIGAEDERKYLHRERLDELAWELTQTDSEANILGAMQSRDFVSLYESNLARELNTQELATLEIYGRLRVVKAGSRILHRGDSSRNFFILNAGLMRVSVLEAENEEKTLAWLRSGSVLGEISFLTGEPRSADVTAETDCIVQEFQPEFIGLSKESSNMALALEKLARKRGVSLTKR